MCGNIINGEKSVVQCRIYAGVRSICTSVSVSIGYFFSDGKGIV